MNDEREKVLSRVRRALAPLPERAPMPHYNAEMAVLRDLIAGRDLTDLFAERIKRVNGLAFVDVTALINYLRANEWWCGYCDPQLWPRFESHFGPEFRVELAFDRSRVDDYAFGMTRAAGAIAETGTVVLNDATTSRRLAALAPWVHVAVVERGTIFASVPDAIAALGNDRNIVWCTGPSKTADVEGILIEGVHGPGVQIALVV